MPATSASSIARPETPSGSLATLASSGPGILQHLVQPLSLRVRSANTALR